MNYKYNIEKMKEQKQLLLRRNKAINDIKYDYINLTEENKENLRNNIKLLFSYNNILNSDDVKTCINLNLYPEINFLGLSEIYSDEKTLQVSFLEKINSEVHYELSRNRYNKVKKIK